MSKNKFTLMVLVTVLLCALVPGRSQTQLTGIVADENDLPLPGASVTLLEPETRQLIRGTVTEADGTYRLDKLASDQYLLAVSFIGYEEHQEPVTLADRPGTMEMPPLHLTESIATLTAVEVKAAKTPFIPQVDRLVVNVAGSTIFTGISALDVLERSPGILVDRQNGNLSIVGRNGVVVMINNRIERMPLSAVIQMLAGMSADNIEKIEIINTPPANFDAEGNAGYIRIVLKKSLDDGLSGSVSATAGYGRGETANFSTNFNYRQGKFNLYGDYSFLRNAREQSFRFNRSVVIDDQLHKTANTSLRDPVQRNHNGRLGVDLELGKRTIVGALLSSYDTKWTMDAFNTATMSTDDIVQQVIQIQNAERNQWRHFGANVNLQHTFREGETLTLNLDQLYYRDDNPSTYLNTYFTGDGQLDFEENTRSTKITPIQVSVGALDYSRKLGNKIKMNAGLKGTISNFTNDVGVATWMNNLWQADPDLTAKYDLEESILAAYTDLEIQLDDKTSAKLGLRYEYTDSNLGTVERENIVDRQYGRFFPSVFLSRQLSEHQGINLSYSRRITRPTFNDMAPFVIFMDPTTFFSGNPALQPAFSNNLKLDYRLKSTLFSLQYSHEDGTIAKFQSRIIPGTNNQLIFAENLEKQNTASVTVSMPFSPAPWWSMFVNLSGVWQRAGVMYDNVTEQVELKSFNLFSSQNFTLPGQFKLEVSGFYNSGSLFGAFVMKPFGGLNLGLQKQFADGSSLRLGVDNILNSQVWRISADISELQQQFDGRVEFFRRTVKLAYTRNFGNTKMKGQRKRALGSEEERKRVQ